MPIADKEHAITRLIACNLVKLDNAVHHPGNRLPPGLDEAHINAWTWIHTTSTAVQPRGTRRRPSTLVCPFG
jgi:hypothetical protein